MYGLCCMIVCFLAFGVLDANVEEHLKKIEHKSAHHCMRNIDFIYVINLDERPEKWASCVQQLMPYGIDPFRFSAINGWRLSNEVLDSVGVKYTPGMPNGWMATCFLPTQHVEEMHVPGRGYIHSTMTLGAVGCIMSHLSVLKDAWDSGYKTIWVMEDDIKIVQDPHILSDLIEKLDAAVGEHGWDLLYTDVNLGGGTMGRPNPRKLDIRHPPSLNGFESDFRLVGARYGCYSMIVRRSGIKKLLKYFLGRGIFVPIDLEVALTHNIQLFGVNTDVVSWRKDLQSDNRYPHYQKNYAD